MERNDFNKRPYAHLTDEQIAGRISMYLESNSFAAEANLMAMLAEKAARIQDRMDQDD